jgi:hypothetical protein
LNRPSSNFFPKPQTPKTYLKIPETTISINFSVSTMQS